jgi:CHAD domain-containing protein
MDMNIALRELREAVDELQCLDLSDEESSASSIEAVLGQFRNFDQLLSSGNPLPDDWNSSKKKTVVVQSSADLEEEQMLRLLEDAKQVGALEFEFNTTLLGPDSVRKFEELGAVVVQDPPSNFCSIKWRRPGR